jgi:uncharacterized sulfatase
VRKKLSPPSLLLSIALLLLPACKGNSPQPATSRPNVLFIMMDDMNTSLGCYGSAMVKSPNIDSLASRGVRFDRAYSQFALCNPSRTSLLSGRRPDTTGVLRNNADPRMKLKDALFMPEYFHQLGYFTARVGKIAHDKQPNSVSFDVSESHEQLGGIDNSQQPACRDRWWCATGNKDEDEPDGRVARRVIDLLEKSREKPFFIAAGFALPHSPWYAPRKYFDLYPPDAIQLPEEPAGAKVDEQEIREARAAYFASVSFIDAQIGLMLKALDRLGLREQTIVVLTSDHGYLLGEHGGIVDKKALFEDVVRVPLIVSAPGKAQGVACPRIVELVDLYPSLAALCELPPPAGMEGISFVPLLSDPQRSWKTAAFSFTIKSKRSALYRSVRTDRYSYIENVDGTEPELYDHQSDRAELVNLAGKPAFANELADMKRILREGWRKAVPPGD